MPNTVVYAEKDGWIVKSARVKGQHQKHQSSVKSQMKIPIVADVAPSKKVTATVIHGKTGTTLGRS